ncbi:MAG TPA: PQQ-binding-like beta-propeller repeat protein [Bryobacteraceae bacterium]|nr:PQQ-binding-like beta-propeller repeat protein [Bryobacteraceae bacterium]
MIATLSCGLAWGADWLTDGGSPRRDAWQRDEHILTKNNVKNLKILWKLKFNNQPREMHSLFPPLIVGRIETASGPKQVAIEAGISDNLYAIDVDAGKVLWKKHFDYPPITEGRGLRPGDPLCPGGQTATPVIGPPNASGARTVYALAGNGELHSLNVADGEDVAPPVKFGFPNGKSYALNLWNGVIFTTTSQGCNGNPNQMWAININDPAKKVMAFNPKSGGMWGRTGAAIDLSGTAWAPTGDGIYDPENHVYGNGLIGVKVVGDELQLQDWFEPTNWSWLRKRDLDMQVTPAIFDYQGKELMVTGSKECRVYLLDTKAAGGDDHQTPLYRTPLLCNEEVNFASAGIWGAMSTWVDANKTRWVLTPFWGPVHPKFKVPVSYGPVTNGAVVAFKVEETGGKFQLTPAWMSRDMNRAEPPVVADGIVFGYGNGEYTEQAYPDRGLFDNSPLRISRSTHAVLYALDAETGKELYSSGDQIASFNHFSGLSVANGRVYIATYDSTLYCFGLAAQ